MSANCDLQAAAEAKRARRAERAKNNPYGRRFVPRPANPLKQTPNTEGATKA